MGYKTKAMANLEESTPPDIGHFYISLTMVSYEVSKCILNLSLFVLRKPNSIGGSMDTSLCILCCILC